MVRPHPQFFHSLYPNGRVAVESLMKRFESDDRVSFELSISNQNSFYSANLMISDWSGAAFEYALGTLRPVLFIDTPQKLFNEEWQAVGLPAFEAGMRSEVGRVVGPDDLTAIGQIAGSMIEDGSATYDRLSDMRSRLVFNFGASAIVGADLIAGLV